MTVIDIILIFYRPTNLCVDTMCDSLDSTAMILQTILQVNMQHSSAKLPKLNLPPYSWIDCRDHGIGP